MSRRHEPNRKIQHMKRSSRIHKNAADVQQIESRQTENRKLRQEQNRPEQPTINQMFEQTRTDWFKQNRKPKMFFGDQGFFGNQKSLNRKPRHAHCRSLLRLCSISLPRHHIKSRPRFVLRVLCASTAPHSSRHAPGQPLQGYAT